MTWGFDLDALLRERTQQAPAVGDAGDGTAETFASPGGGAVDAPSAPPGSSDSDPSAVSTPNTDKVHG